MLRSPFVAGRSRVAVRSAFRALSVIATAAILSGCYTARDPDVTGSLPVDYRQRHPITISQGDHELEVFVGGGRGGLNPGQRAEVLAFAQSWRRDATGGVTIRRPVGGPVERSAHDSLRQVLSILAASGVPNHGIGIQTYKAPDPKLATIHLSYPRVGAQAGPCGLWPNDLGPTYNPEHFRNRPYHNLGCATQQNLAEMVENKADLVQPRAEGPAYTGKRTYALDKWRRGESPATNYPNQNRGISQVGR